MPREKKSRNANGRSSIHQSSTDGVWHGYVTVGVKDNGRSDRRHVRGKTKAEVTEKVRKLERERDGGTVRKTGHTWTVEKWLRHWLDTIMAPPAITENAHDAYEAAVRLHLIPGIGAHRLDKLEAEHLERLYRRMVQAGASPGYAHQVHRTIRAALGEAERRGHITKNPAKLARPPKVRTKEVEPYDLNEVRRVLEAAEKRRNGARWAVALALGLRQGEALGLQWSGIDFTAKVLTVERNRLRPKYRHGCGGACDRKHAGLCPQRLKDRPDTAQTKSEAGKRFIGLPDAIVKLLEDHRKEQQRERKLAAELWSDSGFVFTNPTGEPLIPSTDFKEWKKLLRAAGVPERRLHDARHTAATVLLLLGVPERTVMSIMGWASTSMAARYQHVGAAIRQGVAEQVGGLLWAPTPPVEGDRPGPQDAA